MISCRPASPRTYGSISSSSAKTDAPRSRSSSVSKSGETRIAAARAAIRSVRPSACSTSEIAFMPNCCCSSATSRMSDVVCACEMTYAPSAPGPSVAHASNAPSVSRTPVGEARARHVARAHEQAPPLKLLAEERDARGLVHLAVRRRQPQVARDRVERLRVPVGLLPHVERHEREAERFDAAHEVDEPPVGDRAEARAHQRLVEDAQRREQLGRVEDGRGAASSHASPASASPTSASSIERPSCRSGPTPMASRRHRVVDGSRPPRRPGAPPPPRRAARAAAPPTRPSP